jgi:hypothetical protein
MCCMVDREHSTPLGIGKTLLVMPLVLQGPDKSGYRTSGY